MFTWLSAERMGLHLFHVQVPYAAYQQTIPTESESYHHAQFNQQ
jgi:hypothetical protein